MTLSHFIMLNNELMNKYKYVVPEQEHSIIVDNKSSVSMVNNGKYTKHTRYISIRINFVGNCED